MVNYIESEEFKSDFKKIVSILESLMFTFQNMQFDNWSYRAFKQMDKTLEKAVKG